MAIKTIQVVRRVEQVLDGTQYKGFLEVTGVRFEYEVKFSAPIPQLDDQEFSNLEEFRRIFQLCVRREETPIELTDLEFTFFVEMLAEFVIEFHDNPQTRDANEGFLRKGLRGEGVIKVIGGVTIGITNTSTYDVPSEVCEMLSAPKFGCVFPS